MAGDFKTDSYLTVGALNSYLSAKFSHDPYLDKVYITGEIFGFKISGSSAYFELRDEDQSSIRAYIPPYVLRSISYPYKSGDKVNVCAKVRLYQKRAYVSADIFSIELAGLGKLFAELKKFENKLSREGIFSRPPKQLNFFPRKIAVVTSKTGAVIQDIRSTIGHRNPLLTISLFESQVQGDHAVPDLIKALKEADSSDSDAIIIARGGGSMLDLWPFNSEELVRTIFSLKKPVISSVGHQTDVTLTDLVADYRVETPTAAANKVTPSIDDYKNVLLQLETSLQQSIQGIFQDRLVRYRFLAQRPSLRSFDQVLSNKKQQLENVELRLFSSFRNIFQTYSREFSITSGRLDSLSPLKVLARGFSLTYKDDLLVKNSSQLKQGDKVEIRFASGKAKAEIKETDHD